MALRVTTATPFMSGQLPHCRRRQCSNGGAHYSGISLETRVALLFEPHPFGMVCMAELYEVLDPRPNAAAAPYTFFLPDPELIEAICKCDHVSNHSSCYRRAKSTTRSACGYGLLRPSLIGSKAQWSLNPATCPNCFRE